MKRIVLAMVMLTAMMTQAADNISIVPEKTGLCTACHGPQGNSSHPEWPNIAGQHRTYLLKQLLDMKQDTTRRVPVMSAILATLSEKEIIALTDFYSTQPIAEGSMPKKYLKRGEQLYRGGDFEKHITACIACHGPQGTGNAQAGFPLLSGQHAAYTIQQLQAFKEGLRQNDLNGIMRDISARMSPDDMEAVAYYIQGLY